MDETINPARKLVYATKPAMFDELLRCIDISPPMGYDGVIYDHLYPLLACKKKKITTMTCERLMVPIPQRAFPLDMSVVSFGPTSQS